MRENQAFCRGLTGIYRKMATSATLGLENLRTVYVNIDFYVCI